MTLSPAAEALFDALERRASGTLELRAAHGQRARLSLHEGDLVDAQVGFGFQSLAQVLWRAGQLTPQQLDALWSGGEGGEPGNDALTRLGLDPRRAQTLRWRAQLTALVERAQGFQFVDSPVPPAPVVLPGPQAVRAACESSAPSLEGRYFEVEGTPGCAPWLGSAEEGRWLEQAGTYVAGGDIPAEYRGLWAVLERAGAVASLEAAVWQTRRSRATTLEVPPVQEVPPPTPPAPSEDAARSLTPISPVASVWVDPALEAEVAPTVEPTRVVAAPTPLLEEPPVAPDEQAWVLEPEGDAASSTPSLWSKADSPELPTVELQMTAVVQPEEWETAPPPVEPVAAPATEVAQELVEASWAELLEPNELEQRRDVEEQAAAQARQRAQAQLIREMNEALERSGAASSEGWLDAPESPSPAPKPSEELPELVLSDPEVVAEEVAAPPPGELVLTPEALASAMELSEEGTAPASAPPLPTESGPPAGEVDLWSILQFENEEGEGKGTLHSTFERALESVDQQLEALVASLPVTDADLPEVTLEASFEPTSPPVGDDKAPGSDQTSKRRFSEEELLDSSWDEEDDLEGDPSDPAEAARRRRQRLLRRAMENLGAFAPRTQSSGAVPVQEAPPPSTPAAGATPQNSEEQQLANLITKRYDEVKGGADRFAILGLRRDANKDAVKAAFLNLAKVFHPDRLPPTLSPLAPKMTAVFEAIREAYEALYDDAKRKAYHQELELKAVAAQSSQASMPESAEDAFKKGEMLFRKRDFVAAEEMYARAHELKPSAVYLAGRAWAIYMDPGRKTEIPRAKRLMAEALKMDNHNDRAHYQMGVIARVEGDMERAERHFRDAVTANPRHLEAAQELRLIEMRRKKTR
jgi:curved DNA-binding protein CbpA